MDASVKPTREQIQNERFKRFFVISLALHGAFIASSLLGNLIFPSDAELFIPTVQVDMVALPDLVKSENEPLIDKSLTPKEEAKPAEKPPEKVAEKEPEKVKPKEAPKPDEMSLKRERDNAAKKALERLKEEMKKAQKDAQKKKLEELADRKKADSDRLEALRRALKGNQVNEGTAVSGVNEATKNAYIGMIQNAIKSNWALPSYYQDKGLSAHVVIQIGSSGQLVGFRFTKPSGDDRFDEYVRSAVQQSAPFSAPPEEMARTLRGGIGVRFPL